MHAGTIYEDCSALAEIYDWINTRAIAVTIINRKIRNNWCLPSKEDASVVGWGEESALQ